MTFLGFSGLVNFITCISIATFVILKNIKNPLNVSFFNLNFSVALYSFGYFLWQLAKSEAEAMFWFKILAVGIILINITYLYFVFHFLGLIDKKRNLLRICVLINFIFIILNLTSKLYTRLEPRYNLGFWPVPTIFFHIYLAFWFWQCLYGFYWLLKGLKLYTGIKREQTKYFTISAILGFAGGATNWPMWYKIHLPPYLNITISLYIGLVTYAIFRYRLLDIKVTLTRAGIFAFVYLFVLGIPFWIGFRVKLWMHSTWIMLFLATLGPFIFNFLRRQAETRILVEEHHAHSLLTKAARGMMQIWDIRKLIELIVHITCQTLKIENACVFLFDERLNSYKLESVRLKSRYRYLESLNNGDPLIETLIKDKKPLVYEEVKTLSQSEITSQMEKLSSQVIIPAISRGKLLGFLCLGKKRSKRMYSKEDLAVLQTLSYEAALAIENALLYEKEKSRLTEESRRKALADMAPGASHQFNNRLIAISSTAENLLDLLQETDLKDISKEQILRALKLIISESLKGRQITEAILQKAKAKMEFSKTDLVKLIQNAIILTKIRRTKESLVQADEPEFIFNSPDDLPLLWLCEAPIQESFECIFNNSIDAGVRKHREIETGKIESTIPYRCIITIDIKKQEKFLVIQIQDNGIGIRPEDIPKLFTPYFTTKATSEKGISGGVGLGLWVIRDFIERHGGEINIESEYTKWTKVTIRLPIDFTPPK